MIPFLSYAQHTANCGHLCALEFMLMNMHVRDAQGKIINKGLFAFLIKQWKKLEERKKRRQGRLSR